MKFSIKDFLSKCDQIRRFLQIWSHLLKKSSMENFIFCAVLVAVQAPRLWYMYGVVSLKISRKYPKTYSGLWNI